MSIILKEEMIIMENHFKNNTQLDDKTGKVIRDAMLYDTLYKPRKRVEYILSPKNYPDKGILPFLLKIKDEDNYLIF